MSKIRNIIQSAPSREVVKLAPDMVVYIDGLPFLLNPYVKGDNGSVYTVVNFNDFVTAISCNYGVDSLIPSGSVNLSVPNGLKNLFMAPGGGLILQTMSELRIYAKGYFFSDQGNSVYRRVFNGMVKSVDYNETNTSLEITIGCAGVLRFLEIMRTDRKPGVISYASTGAEFFKSIDHDRNPYQIMAKNFQRDLSTDQFIKTSIQESLTEAGQKDSLLASLVPWQERLNALKKYIHIYGYNNPVASHKEVNGDAKQSEQLITKLITTHTPEMFVGSVNLFGGNIVSRLELLRQTIESIGYEGYQDVDGSVIIKPPLYNLDCTMVGDKDPNLHINNNPFIIHLSEILGEKYTEDESGIRQTRMAVQGSFNHTLQVNMSTNIRHVASFVDVNLVRRFGVRDEPPKQISLLGDNNNVSYAFAAMELAKTNRGFRTYHVTIPLRPELRLGFPIFVPHLDMYAYISTIALAYNVGGTATMSLTCNFIRKRPQFPRKQKVKDKDVLIYVSRPNLVHRLAPAGEKSSSPIETLVGAPAGVGSFTTLPTAPLTGDAASIDAYLANKAHAIFGTSPDTNLQNWRLSEDTHKRFDGRYTSNATGGSKTLVAQTTDYINALRSNQPYTDERGYEVISPFAWGRYTTLSEAIYTVVHDPKTSVDNNLALEATAIDPKLSTFLLAGITTPNLDPSSSALALKGISSKWVSILDKNADTADTSTVASLKEFDSSNTTSFELNFSNELLSDTMLLTDKLEKAAKKVADGAQPRDTTAPTPPNTSMLEKASMFLNGAADNVAFLMSGAEEKDGPDAISLQPQNTDLGGYQGPGKVTPPVAGKVLDIYKTYDKRAL